MTSSRIILTTGFLFCVSYCGIAHGEPRSKEVSRGGTLINVVDETCFIVQLDGPGKLPRQETITINRQTQLTLDGQPAKLEDLKPEMRIDMVQLPASADSPARLLISAANKGISGVFIKRDDNGIVVAVRNSAGQREERAVPVNDDTQIVFGRSSAASTPLEAKTAKLAELQEGMRLWIVPETGIAKKIRITPLPASAKKPEHTTP